MRDKQDFRENLARVSERANGAEMVPLLIAAKIVGLDYRTLKNDKSFPVKKIGRMYYVSVAGLARWMS